MCVQALRPGSALLGTHKGEPYYFRSAVSELHTAFRWRREGREVLPGVRRGGRALIRQRGGGSVDAVWEGS